MNLPEGPGETKGHVPSAVARGVPWPRSGGGNQSLTWITGIVVMKDRHHMDSTGDQGGASFTDRVEKP
jgi:hypothetical protein